MLRGYNTQQCMARCSFLYVVIVVQYRPRDTPFQCSNNVFYITKKNNTEHILLILFLYTMFLHVTTRNK